jgi:hypothetical protein
MRRKYHGYKVYLHNFSNFDGVFLMRILSSLCNRLNPIIREGRIIDLRFPFGSKYSLYFRDSYLLLPSSLAELAINFNVENKGQFPYSFVNNSSISLLYEGIVPNIHFFNKISETEYNEYCAAFKDKTWNLRTETMKYCEQDVRTLHQVIEKFSINIFKLVDVNIHKYPTLSSLAFAIYRSKFMGEAKIPLIHGNMFDFLKRGYTGGSVDVYKPFGFNIFRYDVNSLYPYVMKAFAMPVGKPTYFEGDISDFENKPFGFFEVEVKAPNNLNIPILQTKLKVKSGTRTVSPLGT